MTRRAALVLLVPVLVLGGELFPVSRGQMQVNQERWLRMDPAERKAVRAAWARFQNAGEAERPILLRRMAVVARIQEHRQRAGLEPLTDDELRAFLQGVPHEVEDHLGEMGEGPQQLRDELRARTERRIRAFLDNLRALGQLDDAQRQQLLDLPPEERVRRCLDLQRREELRLYEEGLAVPSHPDPGNDLDTEELEAADPLEAIEELARTRLRRGFLGRAAHHLGLTPTERAELAALPESEAMRRVRRLVVPRARLILEGLQVDSDRIEQILELPYRAQDRVLHRLLLETP